VIALVVALLAAQPPALLDRAIAAYGGAAAIRAHESQVTTWDVELADGAKGRRVSWVRCGDQKAREELTIGGQVFVVGTDGKQTWRWSKTGALPVKSAQLTTSLRVACLGALLLAAQASSSASVDAQGRLVVAAGAARLAITIDGAGRATQLRVTEEGAPDVDVTPSQWTQSEGYPVPRRLIVAVAGTATERRQVLSVGRNARLGDAMFSPPPSSPPAVSPPRDDDTIDL
jgi:hypothetical protein